MPLVKSLFSSVCSNSYANLLDIDHTNKIQDPENPNLERYLRFENDPAIGLSLVGSGTNINTSCTSIVNSLLVHQNFLVNLNLGDSYPTYANTLFFKPHKVKGQTKTSEVHPFNRCKKTPSVNIYSRTTNLPQVKQMHVK